MNSQKVDKTIRQEQKPYMEKEAHPWILEKPMTILIKMEDLSILITIYIGI